MEYIDKQFSTGLNEGAQSPAAPKQLRLNIEQKLLPLTILIKILKVGKSGIIFQTNDHINLE